MSVQIRRRREAAAFLSTYVGAQGELIVDTTSNRVQVHDGATAGGWPAATIGDLPGRNLAINGAFLVNQRGYASGATLAAGAFGHDRWRAGASGCAYTFDQGVTDTTITITSGTLVQAVDAPNVYAGACWLTWTGSAAARVWQGTAGGTFGRGTPTSIAGMQVNKLLVSGLTLGTIVNLEFSTGTLGLVQLEAALPNAGPTRFDRRHLGAELALCQRYYWAYTSAFEFFWSFASGSGLMAIRLSFPVPMRASPTITFSAQTNGTFSSGMPSLQAVSPQGAFLRGDTTAGSVTYLTSLVANAEI